jgi:glycosyltransferase involved in cell wall biosynthesis
MQRNFSTGVIISTYNNPQWLRKTLWGYACQTYGDFELIIADDGSDSETSDLIAGFSRSTFPKAKHLWQPDNGFQKCTILNKALAAAEADYLIFTDQDCIPRADFVEAHLRYAKKG